MKGSRTRLRKVLPEREREEAAVPEAIERLISRGPPAGSGIPFEAWRSWHRYGSLPVRPRSFGIPVPTIAAGWGLPRAGWATEAHGPLECYRDFRQKYARATSQPFRRAAGVFATSTRATGARVKLCQAQAVGRFPAESYSLPIPSFPLQPLRPHNARTRARGRDPIGTMIPCRKIRSRAPCGQRDVSENISTPGGSLGRCRQSTIFVNLRWRFD